MRLSKCIASRQNPRSLGIMRLQTTWMDRSLTWSLCLKFHGDINDDLYDITYYLLHFRSCQTLIYFYILLLPYNDNTLHISFCRPMAFTLPLLFSHIFTSIHYNYSLNLHVHCCSLHWRQGQGPGSPMSRLRLPRGVPAQPGCS